MARRSFVEKVDYEAVNIFYAISGIYRAAWCRRGGAGSNKPVPSRSSHITRRDRFNILRVEIGEPV